MCKNTLYYRLCFHSCRISNTDDWKSTYLPSGDHVFVDIQAGDIIIMLKHELLSVILGIKDNPNWSWVINNATLIIITQVVSCIMTSISVDILKLKACIRCIILSLTLDIRARCLIFHLLEPRPRQHFILLNRHPLNSKSMSLCRGFSDCMINTHFNPIPFFINFIIQEIDFIFKIRIAFRDVRAASKVLS